jgi:molybdopterin synthase sulfur carrier subunit
MSVSSGSAGSGAGSFGAGCRAAGSVAAEPVAPPRAVLRLFAAARLAAGVGRAEVSAATVGEVLSWARTAYGPAFAAVLDRSRVWCNGEPADLATPLCEGDEVAVLPPVSGGT